jgi:TatD DNase family protein
MIDSHCHLSFKDLGEYSDKTINFVNNARAEGIKYMLDIATGKEYFDKTVAFAEKTTGVFSACGIHPCYVNDELNKNFKKEDITQYLKSKKFIAVGETGLDYYHSLDYIELQKKYFHLHCEIAVENNLPIIIHSRNCFKETMEVLNQYKSQGIQGVIHCFSYSLKEAIEVINLGFYISFSGILTYKNSFDVVDAAKNIPLNKILIETDSPFLTPLQKKGEMNQPLFVKFIMEKLCEVRNISIEEGSKQIKDNFASLFDRTIFE